MNAFVTSPAASAENLALTHYPCTGVRLYGQPLVLVHGWGMDSQIWAELPQQLSQFADVITLDLPGFAQSPTLEYYSEADLHQWMAELLPERCYLIGLSLGGMLCGGFAARYPQSVAGLITLSSNIHFVATEANSAALDSQQYLGFIDAYKADSTELFETLCRSAGAGRSAPAAVDTTVARYAGCSRSR